MLEFQKIGLEKATRALVSLSDLAALNFKKRIALMVSG
jgi:hypothetical protein